MAKVYIIDKSDGHRAYYGSQGDKVSLESDTENYATISASQNPQPSDAHVWDFEAEEWILPE